MVERNRRIKMQRHTTPGKTNRAPPIFRWAGHILTIRKIKQPFLGQGPVFRLVAFDAALIAAHPT